MAEEDRIIQGIEKARKKRGCFGSFGICVCRSCTMEKVYREVDIAQRGDDSTAEAYDQRSVGHQHELCCSPHCNTTSKGGILNVDLRKISNRRHIHPFLSGLKRMVGSVPCLAFRASGRGLRWPQWWARLRPGPGRCWWPLCAGRLRGLWWLSWSWARTSTKRGYLSREPGRSWKCPERKEEVELISSFCNRARPTNHSENVRVVHRALQIAALVQVWPIEHPWDGKTIITSKRVDHHGASCIPGLRTGKYSN